MLTRTAAHNERKTAAVVDEIRELGRRAEREQLQPRLPLCSAQQIIVSRCVLR